MILFINFVFGSGPPKCYPGTQSWLSLTRMGYQLSKLNKQELVHCNSTLSLKWFVLLHIRLASSLTNSVSYLAEVEFEFTTWAWVQATAGMAIILAVAFFPATHLYTQTNNKKTGSATTGMKISGSLWQNSGGELKLYPGCTGSR